MVDGAILLYAADAEGRLYRGERSSTSRGPYRKRRRRLRRMGNWLGIEVQGELKILLYAKSIDVKAWLLERL